MSESITTDAIVHAGVKIAQEIEDHLNDGRMSKELVWQFYEVKSTQHIQTTLAYAPEGGSFATLLQTMLEDREDWTGEH